ncbi:MAG: acyltransferase [Acidobacteriota bacterium]|nr:acyltransferase [Acidobacteriota bacterium]MDH3525242.1 acyltransferase [Acidobacteriota bacterium]
MADQTPAARNRYADFLRAASILVVVLGHWLMAAPFMRDGRAELSHMLDVSPWTRWLTWALQIMPTFFVVGGFSNAISWQKTREHGGAYADWLSSRLRRLMAPVLPLLVFWAALGIAAHFGGVGAEMLRVGSQVALVPTWFLAVYILVILLVPLTYRAWQRLGLASFALVALGAGAVDALAFGGGLTALRWINYAFVWAAVHQLGYAWQAGRLGGWRRPALASGGFMALLLLVTYGPFPVSMVGVPGEEISNSLPPTVALLALGIMQAGLVLCLEAPLRRWLQSRRAWAATVLVNANIMTVYLWHSTVLVLFIGLLVKLDGAGLGIMPGTAAWWWSRIPWVLALAVLLFPSLALLGRFERPPPGHRPPANARLPLASALLFCLGIAVLALDGIGGEGPLGIRSWAVALPLVGGLLAGAAPSRRGADG